MNTKGREFKKESKTNRTKKIIKKKKKLQVINYVQGNSFYRIKKCNKDVVYLAFQGAL
jgi:hypothetical protein